jgi:hypothetical protein
VDPVADGPSDVGLAVVRGQGEDPGIGEPAVGCAQVAVGEPHGVVVVRDGDVDARLVLSRIDDAADGDVEDGVVAQRRGDAGADDGIRVHDQDAQAIGRAVVHWHLWLGWCPTHRDCARAALRRGAI